MEVMEATIADPPPRAEEVAEDVADVPLADNQTVPADDGEKADDNIFSSDSEEDDNDVVIRIGDIRPNVPFAAMQKGVTASGTGIGGATTAAGKLDVEKVHELDGVPIYDADIASMTEKPWRKPGADITDYFNYGFNEVTWNLYCERQRKLRAHFGGDQAAANKKLFSGLTLANTVAATSSNVSGHQRAQQKLEQIAQARGTVKVTRLGPGGIEMTADVLASELTGGGNATTALSAIAGIAPQQPQRVSTVNLSNPPPPVDLASVQVHSMPPPGAEEEDLPPPMMSSGPPGYGPPPGAGPPGAYGGGGFGGPPPGYGAPPPFLKHEMEAASYSDTSDIDEPSGAPPPMMQHGRPPPPFAGRGGYGGPPGGHFAPPGGDYRRGRGGGYGGGNYGGGGMTRGGMERSSGGMDRGGGADRDRGRERSRSPSRRSSRRDDRDRGSKRTRDSSRDRDDKRKGGGSKRSRRDASEEDRRSSENSRRRGGDHKKDRIKNERDDSD